VREGIFKMPGYRQGFMDATIVYLAALMHFKDLETLQLYMELVQDKIEIDRVDCVQCDLDLMTFEEIDRIQESRKSAEEVETEH